MGKGTVTVTEKTTKTVELTAESIPDILTALREKLDDVQNSISTIYSNIDSLLQKKAEAELLRNKLMVAITALEEAQ